MFRVNNKATKTNEVIAAGIIPEEKELLQEKEKQLLTGALLEINRCSNRLTMLSINTILHKN